MAGAAARANDIIHFGRRKRRTCCFLVNSRGVRKYVILELLAVTLHGKVSIFL